MDSRLALLHLVRRMGGVEAVAPLLAGGKRPDTLRKELTGVPGYKLGLDDAEVLGMHAVAMGTADAFACINAQAANMGALVVPMPRSLDADTPGAQAFARLAREFGDFVGTLADAEQDGQITANELAQAEREFSELVSAGQAYLTRLTAMHQAGKPGALREVKAA